MGYLLNKFGWMPEGVVRAYLKGTIPRSAWEGLRKTT
jgi:hypothetical protein